MTEWLTNLKKYADSHYHNEDENLVLEKYLILFTEGGYQFGADCHIVINEENDEEITEFCIGGYYIDTLDAEIQDIVKECKYQRAWDECVESLFIIDDDEEWEKILNEYLENDNYQNEQCGKCRELSQFQGYMEMITSGGCW